MLKFEVFKRPGRPSSRRSPKSVPTIAIVRSGVLALNRAAASSIGMPSCVYLLYDPAEKIIGLRAANPDDLHAAPLRFIKSSACYLVGARAFLNYYGVDWKVTRRYVATMIDDAVCIIPATPDTAAQPPPR